MLLLLEINITKKRENHTYAHIYILSLSKVHFSASLAMFNTVFLAEHFKYSS